MPDPVKACDARTERAYPGGLQELEFEAIQNRRDALHREFLEPPQSGQEESENSAPPKLAFDAAWMSKCVGLAISGGGIRSATFALGVLQAMAKHRFLRFVDFLSTVSGGSYIGAFLGKNYLSQAEIIDAEKRQEQTRANAETAASPQEAKVRKTRNRGAESEGKIEGEEAPQERVETPSTGRVEAVLMDSTSPPVYWLRENGRYLAPRGSGDILVAGAASLRDWLSLQVYVGVFVLALLFTGHGLKWVYALGDPDPKSTDFKAIPVHALWPVSSPAAKGVPSCCSCDSRAARTEVLDPGTHEVKQVVNGNSEQKPSAATGCRSVADRVASFCQWWYWLAGYTGIPLLAVSVVFIGFCLLYWVFVYIYYRSYLRDESENSVSEKAKMRREFTEVTAYLLLMVFLLAAYRLVDVIGFQIFVSNRQLLPKVSAAIWVSAGIAGRFWLSHFSGAKKDGISLSAWLGPISTAVGLLLLAVYLVTLSIFSYWCISDVNPSDGSVKVNCIHALVAALALFAASAVLGRLDGFLNLTTLHALYTARLARTFLGASNPKRWEAKGQGVTEPIPGDDLYLTKYLPQRHGGPLHIINTTLNETVSGASQLEQRDRKGLSLAISPMALSVGVSHHGRISRTSSSLKMNLTSFSAQDPTSFELLPAATVETEALSLASWVSISGAAVSTGMGSLSSLGLSMVLAFFNIRLGYWWDSGIEPSTRANKTPTSYWGRYGQRADRAFLACFRVQRYLLDEFFGQFHGPGRRYWNLTDGGHFENTGVYELIRRRLRLIVCLDNGADPGCEFAELGNLVRRARTDFGAEIEFLTIVDEKDEPKTKPKPRSETKTKTENDTPARRRVKITPEQNECLPERYNAPKGLWPKITAMISEDGGYFGSLDDLKHSESCSRRHAAIAIVRYVSTCTFGILVWVKPTLTGDEDSDVIEYHTSHKEFPNESTAQQFFNEAQWESYRNLGHHIGERLMPTLTKIHSTLIG